MACDPAKQLRTALLSVKRLVALENGITNTCTKHGWQFHPNYLLEGEAGVISGRQGCRFLQPPAYLPLTRLPVYLCLPRLTFINNHLPFTATHISLPILSTSSLRGSIELVGSCILTLLLLPATTTTFCILKNTFSARRSDFDQAPLRVCALLIYLHVSCARLIDAFRALQFILRTSDNIFDIHLSVASSNW